MEYENFERAAYIVDKMNKIIEQKKIAIKIRWIKFDTETLEGFSFDKVYDADLVEKIQQLLAEEFDMQYEELQKELNRL